MQIELRTNEMWKIKVVDKLSIHTIIVKSEIL